MNDSDPIGADARAAAHLRSLGPLPHVCAFCGYTDPLALKAKPLAWVQARVPPKLLQDHHVVGRWLDSRFIVLLCANCHLLVHRRYLDDGIDLRVELDPCKRVARMLRARATFALLEAECYCSWADQLENTKSEAADGSENH
jgi:hypothetical protein